MFKLDSAIDTLNEKIGFYGSYLVLPLIAVVGWEVLMRYGFNSPTSWAFEMTVFIYGIHYSLALAYAHKHNTHVAAYTSQLAYFSWRQWEHASSSWAPALYPYKTIMAFGFILLLLQGIAKLIQDIRSLKEIH